MAHCSASSQVTIMIGDEEVDIPEILMEDKDVFLSALDPVSWKDVLTEEEKKRLQLLAPKHPSLGREEIWRTAFSTEVLRFGANPLSTVWERLNSGALIPSVREAEIQMNKLLFQQYKLNQANYFMQLLQELLLSRQELLQKAFSVGSLENMWKVGVATKRTGRRKTAYMSSVEREYKRVLRDIECSDSDEDVPDVTSHNEMETFGEMEYRQILRQHRKRRRIHNISYLNELEQLSSANNEMDGQTAKKIYEEYPIPSASASLLPRKRVEQEVCVPKKEPSSGRRVRKTIKERSQHEGTTAAQAKAIFEVYTPIDNGTVKDILFEPIVLEGSLPKGKYKSYFSLLKAVFEPLNDRKGELGKLSKNLSNLIKSPECTDCTWLSQRPDWIDLTLSSLCYLSAEVGATSSFSPLPHFVPLLEFRDRIDHWKWIGTGRDSELELLVLCNHWLETLDQALPVVDYSDYEPPPPHVWTSKVFHRSSPEEVVKFQQMERERYASPHKAYIYNIRGYESPVGPVKGARVTKKDSNSKARGHALLVPDRPNCVTILSLVRDATSRLPNGEGTRLDLCHQVQDSQYIADSVSETQLNNAVSGALDRLHYEKDPCVRYDGTRKVWIYLHRGRNEEDFERIHWACEVASKQKKMLLARPRIKPKIILRVNGKDEVLEPGTSQTTGDESVRVGKKLSIKPTVFTNSVQQPSDKRSQSISTPTTPHLPQPGQLSLVVASVVHGGTGVIHEGNELASAMQQRTSLVVQKDRASGSQVLTFCGNITDQKPHRKRKQSLKVAELLLEGTHPPETTDDSKLPFQASPSSSSSWSLDSEDPARPVDPVASSSQPGTGGMGKDEWDMSPDVTSSPDTSSNAD